MNHLRQRLSYANVAATLCLALVLGGGTALATGQLAPRSVGERQLRPGAVTADKIRKDAVTAPKIKALAIKSGKLSGGAVDTAKLASRAVTSEKLARGAITTETLSDEAVTGEKVNESTLDRVPSADRADVAGFAEAANPAAFAKIDKSAGIDAGSSRGIAAVKQVETGVYCVSIASFSPRGAQVTLQFEGVGTIEAFARIGGAAACPSPQVEVQTWNGGVRVEAAFFLAVYR